jgi:hypothetical protein
MDRKPDLRNHREMAEPAPPTPKRRTAVYLALALLAMLGCWPFLATLDFPPMGLDSVLWMTRGAPDREGWTDWVFWTQHFNVGYRPVAGLSFTITHALAGLDPFPYRVSDLAIHAVNGGLVFAVARRLAPGLSGWAACLAAGVFLLHPGGEEVVAWIERRSYSIATCLSLVGLWTALGATRHAGARSALITALAGFAFGLALISNEMAVLSIAALPALVFVAAPETPSRLRSSLRVVLPILALVAAFFCFRLYVVGEVGGYTPKDANPGRAFAVFGAYWSYLLTFCIEYPIRSCELHPGKLVLLVASLSYIVWRALQPLSRRPLEPARLLPAVLLAWLVGASFVLAAQRVWFPREVYPLLPPLGLLVGIVAGETFSARHRPLALHLLPQLLLLGVLLADAPALHGQDAVRMRDWNEMRAMFEDIEAQARDISEPALVLLAIPYNLDATRINLLKARPFRAGPPRSTRLTTKWLEQRFAGRRVKFLHALSFPEGFDGSSDVRFELISKRPALVFPDGSEFSIRQDWRQTTDLAGKETAVWLDAFPRPRKRARYVYVRDGGKGQLIQIDSGEG